jgi:hypothetical protein
MSLILTRAGHPASGIHEQDVRTEGCPFRLCQKNVARKRLALPFSHKAGECHAKRFFGSWRWATRWFQIFGYWEWRREPDKKCN